MNNKKIPTREEMALYITIFNCDDPIEIEEMIEIKYFYKNNRSTYNLEKIYNVDMEKSYDFFMIFAAWCDIKGLCLKSLLNILIDVEIDLISRNNNITNFDADIYRENIYNAFKKIRNSKESSRGIMRSDSAYILEEMVSNTYDEAERLVNNYMRKYKHRLFSDLDLEIDLDSFEAFKINTDNIFNNKMSFTKMISKQHGLSPLIEKGDVPFYTTDGKMIHLLLLRGLVSGHLKKALLMSINSKIVIKDLRNLVHYLSMENDNASIDNKIDYAKKILNFIEWSVKHKSVIEYQDLFEVFNINKESDAVKFAAKLYPKPNPSFRKNIKNMFSSDVKNIKIDDLIVIDDNIYDKSIFIEDYYDV